VSRFHDVLHVGPCAELLREYADEHEARVVAALRGWRDRQPHRADAPPIEVPEDFIRHCLAHARERWLHALARVLLGIRDLGHGGALLLTSNNSAVDLSIKHGFAYHRLDAALVERGASYLMATALDLFGPRDNDGNLRADVVRDRDDARRRHDDAVSAERGATALVASLAGVDGLILAVRGLAVRGFGVEILSRVDPAKVCMASDEVGGSRLRVLDPREFGTRHRSMMRYCFGHAGALGFIVSHDGDVRSTTRVRDRLVVWPNVDLARDALSQFNVECVECSKLNPAFPG